MSEFNPLLADHDITKPIQIRRRRIRNILILPKYQLRFVFLLVWGGLCLTGMHLMLLAHLLFGNVKITQGSVDSSLVTLLFSYAILGSLFLLAGSIILGLIYTHRTAGAMYQMKKVIQRIREGDASARVRLRKDDHFQDLAHAFNELMDERQLQERSSPDSLRMTQ